ncbi:MAG: CHAD domain-containing protein [Gammaproteobacteria bacterium]
MTRSQPLEIELKLLLPPAQAPDFVKRMARRRVAPVTQALVTRYFDTPGFDLAACGIALRVRRAGRRWMQTLKTEGERQGGLSTRVEHEMPVAGGALDWARFPPEALAHVPGSLRGAVSPVFETCFTRTAWQVRGRGGAQIEVALDVGEVRAGDRCMPLCEIELELRQGPPDALFALALDWARTFDCLPFDVSKAERGTRLARGEVAGPAKGEPLVLQAQGSVEDGFSAIVQNCLAQFQANLPGVLCLDSQGHEKASTGPQPIYDSEYVHQARVALRRLRAAVRLFRRACVVPQDLLDGLRTQVVTLGPARDWDVLCEETLPTIAPHADDRAMWESGVQVIEAYRRQVHADMRAALRTACPGAWLLAMQRWLLQRGWRQAPEAQRFVQMAPLDAWARHALRRGHRRLVRGAREYAGLAPAGRHALRIAIKRQRYSAEFFQLLCAEHRHVPYLAALRALQNGLGWANDAHVAAILLRDAPFDAGPMGAFARGWLAAMAAGGGSETIAGQLKKFVKLRTCW